MVGYKFFQFCGFALFSVKSSGISHLAVEVGLLFSAVLAFIIPVLLPKDLYSLFALIASPAQSGHAKSSHFSRWNSYSLQDGDEG